MNCRTKLFKKVVALQTCLELRCIYVKNYSCLAEISGSTECRVAEFALSGLSTSTLGLYVRSILLNQFLLRFGKTGKLVQK